MCVFHEKQATLWTNFCVLPWIILLTTSVLFGSQGLPQNARFEKGRLLMNSHLQEISENLSSDKRQPILFLVGENHASVATQKQLARLLEVMLDAQSVDAILVEGTDGPIDISGFLDEVHTAGLSSGAKTRQYWQRQLDAGLIAGYEFVYLVRQDIPVFGVEDMLAKFRFTTDMEARGSEHMVRWRLASNARAVEIIRTAIDRLKNKLGLEALRAAEQAQPALGKAATAYEKAAAPFLESGGDARKIVKEHAESLFNLMLSQYRLRDAEPSLREFGKWIEDYEGRRAALLKKANELEKRSWVSPSDRRAIEEEVGQLKELGDKIERYQNTHKEPIEALAKAAERIDKLGPQLESWSRQLDNAYADFEDAYFRVANILMDSAKGRDANIADIRWFFLNEATKLEEDQQTLYGKKELQERDIAIVNNSLQCLQKNNKTHGVLIVGYAHLEGIKEILSNRGVAFVSGKLPASHDESQPWELKAWGARKMANANFADPLKEETRFRQKQWLAEIPAMLRWSSTIGPGKRVLLGDRAEAKLFEDIGPNKELIAICLANKPNLDADRGEYVRDIPPDPANESSYLLIIDRKAAMEEVDKLNNDDYVFAYLFPKSIGSQDIAQWYVHCQGQTRPLEQFRAASVRTTAGAVPKQIVFIEEVESPTVRRSIQSGGGGGGTQEPPRRGALAFASSPKRAMAHLILLAEQRKSPPEDLLIVDDAELDRMDEELRFTTKDGEHAHAVVFIAKNTQAFREKVHRLAEASLLKHKQIGLLTCGDAFEQTATLCEDLLRAQCAIVWFPGEMIRAEDVQQVRQQLVEHIQRLRKQDPTKPLPRIDVLMDGMFKYWKDKDPKSPHRIMESSASVVRETRSRRSDVGGSVEQVLN
jgi:hypothetical protein